MPPSRVNTRPDFFLISFWLHLAALDSGPTQLVAAYREYISFCMSHGFFAKMFNVEYKGLISKEKYVMLYFNMNALFDTIPKIEEIN